MKFLLYLNFIYFILKVNSQDACKNDDGTLGKCVSFSECPHIMEIVEKASKPLSLGIVGFLRSLHCGGFTDDLPNICCADLSIRTDNDGNALMNHQHIRLINNENCGALSSNKISNGNATDLGEYPWMTLLQYKTDEGLQFLCAGSLINSRYVLTAAHCITNLPNNNNLVAVRLGEYDISTDIDCKMLSDETICSSPVQDIAVEKSIAHPMYDIKKFANNDIGLVRLAKIADLKPENVRPICLPIYERHQNTMLKYINVAGWGITEKQKPSDQLLQATLTIVNLQDCIKKIKGAIDLNENQICAGTEAGIGSCQGDSGGPLMFPVIYDKSVKYMQFGIISAGNRVCGGLRAIPGIYTKVSKHINWILDQISE